MRKHLLRSIAAVLIVAFLAMLPACYGSFELTKKVHKFNGSLDGKFINEIGFLVMVIIPIYGGATFLDAVIFNTIEFWTGSNPLATNTPGEILVPGENMAIMLGNGTNNYRFTQTINGQEVTIYVEYVDGASVAKDAEGHVLARCVPNADGGVTIYDGSGNVTGTMTRTQIDAVVAAK